MSDSKQPFNALPPSHRLQEYELVRVLGFGDFDITYLGIDHNLKKAVVIKEYLPSDIATRTTSHSVVPLADDVRDDFQWGLDRFLDEAQTLACFDHYNIIKVYRFFKAHGTAYIVMEYAEGETLSAYLERKKRVLSEAELGKILYPLLDGLVVVHGANLLHRDIKPDNIVIRAEDRSPVLLNFGAVRLALGEKRRPLESMLTLGYTPIKKYGDKFVELEAPGPWTDLYALGAVCYRALKGEQVPSWGCEEKSIETLSGFLWDRHTDKDQAARTSETTKVLLRLGAGVQVRDNEGLTPLHWAARRKVPEMVEVLLRLGADIQVRDNEGVTPLHWAARLGAPEMVEVLLRLGADIQVRDNEGLTPLHWAMSGSSSSPEMVEVLLRLGADIQAQDNDGNTPLHRAVEYANTLIARELVRCGAVVDAKNAAGETPLHVMAKMYGMGLDKCSPGVLVEMYIMDLNKCLLDLGAAVDAKNDIGETPLHYAAEYDSYSVAEKLLRHGAAVNVRDRFGYTPLSVAMEYNASGTAEVLRRYGGRE